MGEDGSPAFAEGQPPPSKGLPAFVAADSLDLTGAVKLNATRGVAGTIVIPSLDAVDFPNALRITPLSSNLIHPHAEVRLLAIRLLASSDNGLQGMRLRREIPGNRAARWGCVGCRACSAGPVRGGRRACNGS